MPRVAVRDVGKEEYWRRMVRGQKGSRLSIRAWCRQHGKRESAFYWWRSELNRRDARRRKATFVPVRVTREDPASADGVIEIVLVGGRRVRLHGRVDRHMLADVLAVLHAAHAIEPEGRAC